MLYFVKPFGQLSWTENVDQTLIDLARAHNKDLAQVSEWWKPSERAANDDDVRVALRYGIAATGGIVVDAGHVVTVQRPGSLRVLAAENSVRTAAYNASPQVKMVDEYLEQMMPGWKAQGRTTDAGVEASLRDSIREAERDAAQELAGEVKPELTSHWQLLGGSLPVPL
ncbi:hypothetical protein HF576_02070 [Microbacterium sp. CFH 90308]|uniref:Uncharacterized protein n=1 Tax=Microbacterium salsuginis TaxID=2722803 RepID=A0ABX1KB31_9MICO|nr:hypothetical protein [Microbacterium sp. CFH 90308]NLP82626.1 hypothetical protein [Microbacterium sp. CFH 90308]